jgi:hypothetical protein
MHLACRVTQVAESEAGAEGVPVGGLLNGVHGGCGETDVCKHRKSLPSSIRYPIVYELPPQREM